MAKKANNNKAEPKRSTASKPVMLNGYLRTITTKDGEHLNVIDISTWPIVNDLYPADEENGIKSNALISFGLLQTGDWQKVIFVLDGTRAVVSVEEFRDNEDLREKRQAANRLTPDERELLGLEGIL